MDILDVLANWARWIFDAFGVNLILKKIARMFSNTNDDDTKSDINSVISSKLPQSWNV
ncbi:hypothetical protein ACFSUS_28400 [Spirosoma soli]|uniref:Uncharacterized protein n=1 Tax=Spirosoma soli TaxID=1770529 RepID=A0ABW5MDH2_9BACT